MNMTRKNFLKWSSITTGSLVFGTALPACGGGGGGGSSSVGSVNAAFAAAPPAFSASIAASRISGVAPLYVNFDATGTTHPQISNPTHDLFYSWSFGDASAGVWANGVQSAGLTSKNAAFGPVTGHVFEKAGAYDVELIAMDGINTVTKTVRITVEDPDNVYKSSYGAGYETICISSSGNFTGAPGTFTPINTAGNTDIYAAWNTNKGSKKRILFCKADSWTCSTQVAFTNITDTIVGGYGTGVARGFGSGTLVNVNAASLTGSVFATYTGCSNIRICDFKVLGSGITLGLSLNNGISQLLAYRLEFRGVTGGFNAYPGGGGTNNVFDQHCIYECVVDNLYGYAFTNTPTASASGAIGTPGVFTATAHPFAVGYKVRLIGTPPAPLTTGTDYFISTASFAANTFTLSSSLANANAGVSLALSGTGTCTATAQTLNGGIGAFVGLVRGGVMGCYIDTCNHGEQTLRIPFADRAHVNNNYLARPNQEKNVVKVHSFIYSQVALYTEKLVISANFMDMRGGYEYNSVVDGATIVQVAYPSIICGNGGGGGLQERVRNVIMENNYTQGCLGQPKGLTAAANINCPNVTLRNNIADFSMGDRTSAYVGNYQYTSIQFCTIASSTSEATDGVRVYNNTLYTNLQGAEKCNFVWTLTSTPIVTNILIKNNLWYTPYHGNGSIGALYSQTASVDVVTASNNTDSVTGGSALNTPNFAVQPPVGLVDWRPTSGYALNQGATILVLRDFNNSNRYGSTYDLGAVLP